MVFSRRTFNKFRYELLFIGLSVLLLVGIGLLPKSPSTSEALVAPVTTVAHTPILTVIPKNQVSTKTSDSTSIPTSPVQVVTRDNAITSSNFTNPQSRSVVIVSRSSITKFVLENLH